MTSPVRVSPRLLGMILLFQNRAKMSSDLARLSGIKKRSRPAISGLERCSRDSRESAHRCLERLGNAHFWSLGRLIDNGYYYLIILLTHFLIDPKIAFPRRSERLVKAVLCMNCASPMHSSDRGTPLFTGVSASVHL